ncbi:MAG: hypothetical protein QOH70_3052 [Blastocatellia bacterium]|jgi:hypothetical protein|nr:hypothetical protein [Blastocatellia bacterium]
MKRPQLSTLTAALFALTILVSASHSARAAATIVILNNDSANTGFNDPTAVAPVGGNTGTTLGQQRLNAFQFAANIWGATLNSTVTITIRANWAPLTCSSSSGVLGQAGAIGIFSDFTNAPFARTWYSEAEADALSGRDLDPASPEISATFNSKIGSAGCLDNGGPPTPFYLGLDNAHGAAIDLAAILMHEFAHGLGFQTFSNSKDGTQPSGLPSIYDRFLMDNTSGKTWDQMTNSERQASAINTSHLVWNGPQTTADVANTLGTARLRVNSPGGIAGNYTVATADFGARLSSPGLTANVAQASPADGCSALTNSGAIAGGIALIDRGTCTFVAKVKNAQVAGAVGVIIANSPTGVFGEMGGGDATITIPSVMISLADGNTLKGQLNSGLNATLLLDVSTHAGADAQGRAMMFAPNPIQSGSSVSHWDSVMFPNQLMEPSDSGDSTHSVTAPQDLTASFMRDIGWPMASTPAPTPTPTPTNPIDTPDFFVKQHYLDFLNRPADTSGLNFWTAQITSCGTNQSCIDAKRVNVSAAFYLSIEFQQTGYLVERVYKSAYGDSTGTSTFGSTHTLSVPIVRFSELLADALSIGQNVVVGQGAWEAQLESNKQAFMSAFVQRPQFTSAYPNTSTPAQFVDLLFGKAGVTPSSTERQSAIDEFSNAPTSADAGARGRALRKVAENATLNQREFNRAFVLMQYFGYLRRNPNDAPDSNYSGYDFWLTKLNQFNGDFASADMVKAFITSAEYRQRFGP